MIIARSIFVAVNSVRKPALLFAFSGSSIIRCQLALSQPMLTAECVAVFHTHTHTERMGKQASCMSVAGRGN